MYPHVVEPRRIRLSRRVDLVPQLGHTHALRALAFAPEPGILAALDAGPTVRVWSIERPEVLLVAPLPHGNWDKLHWASSGKLAARQVEEDGSCVWWARSVRTSGRWRPHAGLAEVDDAWDERERFETEDGKLTLHRADGSSVAIDDVDVRAPRALDPLGRFGIVATDDGRRLRLLDTDTADVLREIDVPEAFGSVRALDATAAGDLIIVLGAEGHIGRIEPLQGAGIVALSRQRDGVCIAVGVQDGTPVVAVGDEGGQITLLTVSGGQRIWRTPKHRRSFRWELGLVERIGYIGARTESFTSWLPSFNEIKPVRPLPGAATAICTGSRFPRLLASLDDARLVEIDLAEESVSELSPTPWPVHVLVPSQYGAVGAGDEGWWWFDGDRGRSHEHDVDDGGTIRCAAVERDGSRVALGRDGEIAVYESDGTRVATIDGIARPRSMVFVAYKSGRRLVVVDDSGVLWRCDAEKSRAVRAGVVSPAERDVRAGFGMGVLAGVGALATDDDDTLRALVHGDNGHRGLVILDPKTAEARLLAGVVVVGHQIVACYDDEGTYLREDEQRSVRIVRDLVAHEPHDWLRRPDPGAL